MNKRFQLFFVSFLSTAFVVVTILVLLNVQGYKIDVAERKIIETGGIYVKTLQPDVSVYVNDHYENITSPFTRYWCRNYYLACIMLD